jgi:hypothetical protein
MENTVAPVGQEEALPSTQIDAEELPSAGAAEAAGDEGDPQATANEGENEQQRKNRNGYPRKIEKLEKRTEQQDELIRDQAKIIQRLLSGDRSGLDVKPEPVSADKATADEPKPKPKRANSGRLPNPWH